MDGFFLRGGGVGEGIAKLCGVKVRAWKYL